MNYTLVAGEIVSLIFMLFVKEQYNRTNIDLSQNQEGINQPDEDNNLIQNVDAEDDHLVPRHVSSYGAI